MHDANCVLSLTYDDEHLPVDGSLVRDEVPKFVRALRKRGVRTRYFQSGEYGDEGLRPHYHACLFGYDFPDKSVGPPSRSGAAQYFSPELDKVWGKGRASIGDLTFESAAYVARYVCKKVTGSRAAEHYERVNPLDGELVAVEPEFATMSNRPGIGATWFDKYGAEVYPHDEVIVRGRRAKPPRYYDRRLSEGDLAPIKSARVAKSIGKLSDNSTARLSVREVCVKSRLNLFPRGVE